MRLHAALPALPAAPALAAVLVLLGVVALGAGLRLADPLSNPVMAAEDPFTHMALTREHLRDGHLDPQNPRGGLYPPGLHAVLASLWVYSGGDLYDLLRFGPVIFGVVSLAGLALLLGRWEGALAAFAGVLALAVLPEEIARTTMMSPTALDLALLPFLLVALVEVWRGRLAWLAAAAPLLGFLVLAHPWVVPVVALGAALAVLGAFVLPWGPARGPAPTRGGLAALVALLGVAVGLALASRWTASGTGFGELPLPAVGTNAGVLGAGGALAALALAGLLLALPRGWAARLVAEGSTPRPWWVGVAGVAAFALLIAAIALPAARQGMPELVDPGRMIGWPVLALAVVGLLALPLAGSPAGWLGAGLFLVTLPFTIQNPLDSPFWPHRTAVFLGFAAAILAGVATARAAEAVRRALAAMWGPRLAGALRAPLGLLAGGKRRSPGGPRAAGLAVGRPAGVGRAVVLSLVPALLVGSTVGAAVLGGTPEPYPGGWYRYYNQCEFDALRRVADLADDDPASLVVTGSWQSQLVLAAFMTNSTRAWYKAELFTASYDHGHFVRMRQLEGRPAYIVVDRYLPQEVPNAYWGFLDAPPWVKLDEGCPGLGEMRTKFTLYLYDPR